MLLSLSWETGEPTGPPDNKRRLKHGSRTTDHTTEHGDSESGTLGPEPLPTFAGRTWNVRYPPSFSFLALEVWKLGHWDKREFLFWLCLRACASVLLPSPCTHHRHRDKTAWGQTHSTQTLRLQPCGGCHLASIQSAIHHIPHRATTDPQAQHTGTIPRHHAISPTRLAGSPCIGPASISHGALSHLSLCHLPTRSDRESWNRVFPIWYLWFTHLVPYYSFHPVWLAGTLSLLDSHSTTHTASTHSLGPPCRFLVCVCLCTIMDVDIHWRSRHSA